MAVQIRIPNPYLKPSERHHGMNHLDTRTFAKDLAPCLSGTFTDAQPDNPERGARIEFDDKTHLTIWTTTNDREKVVLTLYPSDIDQYAQFPNYRGEYKLPSITVSTNRSLTSIAADIKRRLIEPAKEPIAKRREYIREQNATHASLVEAAQRARDAMPAARIEPVRTKDQYSTALRISGENGPYIDAEINAKGRVSIRHFTGDMTLDQFKQFAVMVGVRIGQTRSFEDWIARVESEIASDVQPEAYRRYYDAGLSPIEAVIKDREGA